MTIILIVILKKVTHNSLTFELLNTLSYVNILTLLEILGFATIFCNKNLVACDITYSTCIYGLNIHVHTYIQIQM
jgi:hypothetical protein